MIFGPPGVGKSSLFKVLLGDNPDPKRSTTGVLYRELVQVKVAITTTADKPKSLWKSIKIEEEISRLRSTIKRVIAKQSANKRDAPKQEKDNRSVDAVNSERSQMEVEKKLFNSSSNVSTEVEYASTIMTCYYSGGQPEFFDVMPALTTIPSGNVMVFNMFEDLDSKIDSEFFEEGIASQLQHKSHYTTAELMKTAIANIQSYSKNVISDVNIVTSESSTGHLLVVGTHLDKFCGQTIYEKQQRIDEIEKKMCHLLEEAIQMVHCNCKGRIIHPISNIVCEGRDEAAQQIRTAIEDMSKNEKSYSQVPINWLLSQLEVQLSKKNYITRSKCVEIAEKCYIQKSKVDYVLMYFHQLGILLYYKEVTGLENIIFSNPQWVFNQLTKLIKFKYNPPPSSSTKLNKGIFSKKNLRHIYNNKLDKEGVLKYEDLLELFVHLKIMSVLPNKSGCYFMPALLNPAPKSIPLQKEFGIKVHDTMLVKFSGMCIPRGMFCCLVTHLSQTDWEIQFKHIYRNLIILQNKPNQYVALFDKINHMAVEIYCKEDSDFETNHYAVCNGMFKGLEKLCKQFQMKSDYEFGFACKECEMFSGVKLQYPFSRNTFCSNCEKSCRLTDDQLVWLLPSDIFKPEVCAYLHMYCLYTNM